MRLLGTSLFLNGAFVMAFEILLSRLVVPYFGSSVYVWGNLIGMVLLGLAAGSYGAGRLSDRGTSAAVPAYLQMLAGALILVLPSAFPPVCAFLLALKLPPVLGSFLALLFLCLPITALLGTLAPFVFRLAAPSAETAGGTAGRLGALSTMGSLAGTFLATFLIGLAPYLGTQLFLQSIGLGALVLGSLLTLSLSPKRKTTFALSALTACFGFAVVGLGWNRIYPPLRPGERLIEEQESPYHRVRVLERSWKLPGGTPTTARVLQFPGEPGFQSAVDLNLPGEPSLIVYSNFFRLAWELKHDIRNVLMIGGGGGVVARDILRERSESDLRLEVIELDPIVTALAARHFGYPVSDPRLSTRNGDGRVLLGERTSPSDLILVDAFSSAGQVPEHLATREFFTLARRKLAKGGVLAMNLSASADLASPVDTPYFSHLIGTLNEVFEGNLLVLSGAKLKGRQQGARLPLNTFVVFAAECGRQCPGLRLPAGSERENFDPVHGKRLSDYLRSEVDLKPMLSRLPETAVLTDDANPINLFRVR